MQVCWRSPNALSASSGSHVTFEGSCRPKSAGCLRSTVPNWLPFQWKGLPCGVLAEAWEQQRADEEGRREVTGLARRAEINSRDLEGGQSSELSMGDNGPGVGNSESGTRAVAQAPGTRSPNLNRWGQR